MCCCGLTGSGVNVKKTTVEKYTILVLLAGDIKGIYVEYIQIYLQARQQEKGSVFLWWLGVLHP